MNLNSVAAEVAVNWIWIDSMTDLSTSGWVWEVSAVPGSPAASFLPSELDLQCKLNRLLTMEPERRLFG